MENPPAKLAEARHAVAAGIGMLPDGARFAVIAGTDTATIVYPASKVLATASRTTRAEAQAAIHHIRSRPGVAFGRWLRTAGELLHDVDLGHAILLTDSADQDETPAELSAAVDACRGAFSCDCRGLGVAWEVGQLRQITTALNGTVDIVPDPAGLPTEVTAMVNSWMGKTMVNPILRIWAPDGARVTQLKQCAPTVEDITPLLAPSTGQDTTDCRLGVWGAEYRDYHLIIDLPPWRTGIEVLAALVSIICPDSSRPGQDAEIVAQAQISVQRTDDDPYISNEHA